MKKPTIGFIGLGLMGAPMAQNILKKGFPLVVYNRNPKRVAPFKKLKCTIASSAAEVGRQSDIIITVVTGPKDVEQVILGKAGVVEGAKKGSIIIDMSTIGPQAAREIAATLSNYKTEFLDAPVTGGTHGAEAGTLTIFVGGNKSTYKKALPVLEAMGKNIVYCGDLGTGQATKLVNNLIVGETLAALAEGFLLGEAQGLTRKQIMQFLGEVPALSPMMKTRLDKMVKGKYDVTFSVANMYKDLDLALKEIQSNPSTRSGKKLSLPILENTAKLYKKAIDKGWGELDNSSILKSLEE
jgi:3-hydroxyisobutyrate dehydrogenase